MIEKISSNNSLIAILLKNTYKESGVNFFIVCKVLKKILS